MYLYNFFLTNKHQKDRFLIKHCLKRRLINFNLIRGKTPYFEIKSVVIIIFFLFTKVKFK